MNISFLKTALPPIILAVILALIPVPKGLTLHAWLYFALFAGVILALILEPIPASIVGLIGVTIAAIFSLPVEGFDMKASASWALSGFSNTTVWLIFLASIFSLGYQKSGLGRRVSLFLVKKLGKSNLGLGYALSISDLVLAPFIPSNTARSGGTIYPVAMNIPPIYDSYPDKNPERMGRYVVWASLSAVCVTSSMFATSLAPTVLGLSLLEGFGIKIGWLQYFIAAAPALILLFLISPILSWLAFKPTAKASAEMPKWAASELQKLGKTTFREWGMLISAFIALILWIFGHQIHIHGTMAAFIAVFLMLAFRVVSWQDIISHKSAFNVFIWFATMVALATGLKKTGFLDWMAHEVSPYLHSDSIYITLVLLSLGYFLIHYLFASTTAHVSALLPIVMATMMPVIDPAYHVVLGLVLVVSLGIMGIITPYATGPSPIWYGSNFISSKQWWIAGAVFGALYFLAFILIDIPWMLYYAV